MKLSTKLRVIGTAVLLLVLPSFTLAQRGLGAANPRTAAPIDLTGYWVSVVTEDWRWRMVTPRKGDYPSIPLNPEGRRVADAWDPAKDEAAGEQCRSYGAGNIMRQPGRLRISWENDNTMKIEADAGTQSRLLHFGDWKPESGAQPAWQGDSVAQWEIAGGGRGRGPSRGGDLKVVTTHMKPGYLQKNGVPYSANATVTEYIHRTDEPNGDEWLIVTTMVDDPVYLNQTFTRSSHFKKQAGATGWNPAPCTAR